MTPEAEADREPARVTVVIACYDDGATVEAALGSALAQPCEVIVVDDGSTDPHTIEVLGQVEGPRVRVVHQENAGPGAARLRGFREATTRYVIALDADDELLPGTLDALADRLDEDPGLSVVWGDYEVHGGYERVQHTAFTLDPWQITYLDELPVASMIRREALDAAAGEHGRTAFEDWSLWMALARHGHRGARVPIVAYRYRRRAGRRADELLAGHVRNAAELRTRHAELFAARARNWRRSDAPLLNRLLLPVVERLPGLPTIARLMLLDLTSTVAHRRWDTLRWSARRRLGQRAARRQSSR